jgi:F-type H+-transporting ATPase subunit b
MQDIFKTLEIDPRQIITTIIGFGIFFFILYKFAFGPFMKLLENRKETITGTFARMEDERKDIEIEKEKYQNLIANIEDERHKQLQEGLQESKKLAQEIQDDARKKAELIVQRANEAAQRELEQAKLALRNYMVDLSIKSAELALKEVITQEDHKRLIRRYINELSAVEAGGGEV